MTSPLVENMIEWLLSWFRCWLRKVDICRELYWDEAINCLLAVAIVRIILEAVSSNLRSGSSLAALSLESSDSLLSPLGSHLCSSFGRNLGKDVIVESEWSKRRLIQTGLKVQYDVWNAESSCQAIFFKPLAGQVDRARSRQDDVQIDRPELQMLMKEWDRRESGMI